jgi:hypothetical protein
MRVMPGSWEKSRAKMRAIFGSSATSSRSDKLTWRSRTWTKTESTSVSGFFLPHGPRAGRTELPLGVPPRRAVTLAYTTNGHAQLEQAVKVDGAGRHEATILAQPLLERGEQADETGGDQSPGSSKARA